ncbi:MAG TPA: hypothetical protein PKO09_17125 [Anaerolineae bacterium]|nr:hypothetical protein [Anaerolineae bacterium]
MITVSDLEVLRSFDSRGRYTLSAYLHLDGAHRRESAYEELMRLIRSRLEECGSDPECRDAIAEDMEIVGLYLRSNGHRHHAGLAIFSCAAELFWRAYPLQAAVPTQVSVGPAFNLEPLRAPEVTA